MPGEAKEKRGGWDRKDTGDVSCNYCSELSYKV